MPAPRLSARSSRTPGVGGTLLLGLAALYALGASVGPLVGGTQAAFSAQTANPGNAVASLYVQAPAPGSATSSAGGTVSFAWTASPTNATRSVGYLVYRRPSGGSAYTRLTSSPITALTYTDTPAADGTYEYVVQAAVSTFTSPDSARVAAQSDRTAPTVAVSATAGGSTYLPNNWTNRSVTVSFACTDAVSGVAACPSAVTLSAEGSNLSAGGTATDKAGNSAAASMSGIRIDLTAPSAPSGLAGGPGANGSGSVSLTWTPGADALSGVSGHDVYYAPYARATGCGGYAIAADANTGSSATVTGLASGSRYCFYVAARDQASNAASSGAITNIKAG